ncbi:MAG TPA: hypothetical protein VN875_00075 [Candidatus Binatus sp.]|jgi:hypothetical protein|nr:hypothetical protein [Candidatus Binatus sp.]
MDANKRNFLAAMIPVTVGIPLGLFSSAGIANAQRAMPIPPASADQQGTPPLHQDSAGPDNLPKPNPKDILKQNQQQIHDDVEKLYKLATELKDEVEKTDATNTLSLPMIQKAEQIEKLAKQVKNLTRAY